MQMLVTIMKGDSVNGVSAENVLTVNNAKGKMVLIPPSFFKPEDLTKKQQSAVGCALASALASPLAAALAPPLAPPLAAPHAAPHARPRVRRGLAHETCTRQSKKPRAWI